MKILIVDDSSTMRRIIKNTLDQIGAHDILEACDGVEGMAQLNKHPDTGLVLLDWNMPNMNGLEFLEKVRPGNKEVKILMVTTEAEKSNVITAIKAGANGYIVKPFTGELLGEKLAPFIS